MADSSNPLTENLATANSISSLLTSIFGTGTRTTQNGSETVQTQFDDATLQRLLQSALEQNSGLASVASGQRRAGMYNSNVNSLLTNDLLARLTTNVAAAGAPRVTTRGPTTESITPNAGSQLTSLMGLGLMGLGTDGRESILKKFKDLFGSVTDSASVPLDYLNDFGAATPGAFESFGQSYTDSANFFPGAGTDIFNLSGAPQSYMDFGSSFSGFNDGANWANPAMDGMSYMNTGADAFNYAGGFDFGGGFGLDAGANTGLADWGVGGTMDSAGGSFLGGFPVFSGLNAISDGRLTSSEIGSVGGGWAGAELGTALLTPALGPLAPILGGLFGSSLGGGCFITQAVCGFQNKPDDCFELQVLRAFRDEWLIHTHPEDVKEYYEIAPAIAEKLKTSKNVIQSMDVLYHSFIVPSIQYILKEQYEEAYSLYKLMVTFAKTLVTVNDMETGE